MDTTYYPYSALSCIWFLFLYKFVSPILSARFFPKYKSLPLSKQREWDSRTNSSVHAVLVTFTCIHVFLYEDAVNKDPVWGDSPLVKINCAIVIGYMLADMIVMLLYFKDLGEYFYVFHHAASIYAYYFVTTYSVLEWFANYRLIAEMSTPFVNQRWFLDALGYPKTSPIFVVNGFLMVVVFFCTRILAIPPYWYKIYITHGTPECLRLGAIWWVPITSCLVLDSLNVYWFYKMFQGARKIIKNVKESKPKSEKTVKDE